MEDAELEKWSGALEAIVSQPGQTTIEASVIEPWLLLGGKPAAEDAMRGNTQGVTHVLNCCEPWCADGPNSDNLDYVGFEAYDEAGYPLLATHFETTARPFLERARHAGGRCLVHCAMGVNRSAAIVVAYSVACLDMDLLSAVEHVRRSRGCILGNRSFRAELVNFASAQGRLGDVSLRDHWLSRREPPPAADPFKCGAPPEAWRSLPLKLGARVRIRQCADEWAEGFIAQLEADGEDNDGRQLCVVRLDDGGEDCVPVFSSSSSPDICAIPRPDFDASALP